MKDCIAFTGGGTGGHIFPGIAVIKNLQQKGYTNIAWIGSSKKMDRDIVEKAEIPFYRIPSGKLRRYFSFRNFVDIFKVFGGLVSSFFLLWKLKPRVLFSKGGYVTVPPVMAARLLKIPVLTHESDYDPGIATKLNALSATTILTSFEDTVKFFSPKKAARVIYTGNPVRQEIKEGNPEKGRELAGCPRDRKMILVIGGSLGSEVVNRGILKNLDKLTEKYFVVHQMGAKGFQKLDHPHYWPAPFFTHELPHLFAAADLVISRAGSNTLWELAATATPSVLIPLSTSGSRGDQIRNAELFRSKGAARVCEEENINSCLLEIILNLIDNESSLEEMKKNLLSLAKPDTNDKIVELILKAYGDK